MSGSLKDQSTTDGFQESYFVAPEVGRVREFHRYDQR
jgi:hypothetical protein